MRDAVAREGKARVWHRVVRQTHHCPGANLRVAACVATGRKEVWGKPRHTAGYGEEVQRQPVALSVDGVRDAS